MNDFYTYAYLREDGSPYYVGKGRGDRVLSVNRCFKPPCLDRVALLRENMSEKNALDHEIEMIKAWGRKDLGTGMLRNLTDGGEGISGYKLSDETKAKMSLAKQNISDETRAKLRFAKLGKRLSEEHKSNMRLANLGKKLTDETKAKMSLARIGKIGRKHTEESKAKMSLAKKGKIFSKEHKAKMSLAQIARYQKNNAPPMT